MSVVAWLALYSGLVLLSSLFGGSLPFLGRVTHSKLQFYLSLSAGVMLGAAFFHVMPDAIEKFEGRVEHFGWWMALAVVGLFCIERFIAPHSHEIDNGHHHHAGDGHTHHGHHHHEHAHDQDHGHGGHLPADKEPRAAAPAVAGWMAVLGLTIHTFMNGFGLAGEVQSDTTLHGSWLLPGWAIFLAIILHKPADALAISMVLSRKGVSGRRISVVQLGFALMVPIGAATFYLVRNQIAPDLRDYLTGAALAFSAGTFLFIALSDLLPEVQFHQHDRLRLFLTLVGSVLFMAGIGFLEDFGKHEPEPAKQEKVEDNAPPGRGPEPGH